MTTSNMIAPMIDPRSELADVLDTILRDLGRVVRYDQVRILLLPSVLDMQGSGVEDDENTLLITVRQSGELGMLQGTLDPFPLGRYPLNRLLMTSQKPIVIADTRAHELWVADSAQPEEIRSWIGAPLAVKGESIGVLAAHSITPEKQASRPGVTVYPRGLGNPTHRVSQTREKAGPKREESETAFPLHGEVAPAPAECADYPLARRFRRHAAAVMLANKRDVRRGRVARHSRRQAPRTRVCGIGFQRASPRR